MSIQTAARKGSQPPRTLLELLGMTLKQVPKNLLRQIPFMVLISGFTWVFHTYLLVFINQGFDVTGASVWIKAALSGKGSPTGILFWTLMGGIASFGFNQLRQNGLGKTFKAIGSTPGWFARSLKGFSITRLPLLLSSLAVGFLVLAILNSPLYAIQFGLMLMGEWLAQGKGLLGIVLPLAWSDMQRLFRRRLAPAPFNVNWMALILVGFSISAFCGLIFPFWLLLCNMMLVVIVIVVLLATKTGRPTPRTTMLLLAMLLALGALATRLSGVVFADDGGWTEAGGTLGSWLSSEGAILAIGYGFFPSFGAGLGWLFGSALAGMLNFPAIFEPEIITEPKSSSAPDWVTDPEVIQAIDAWQKELDDANHEAEKYKKQWDEVKDSYDVNDPNYQKLKDQYTQYINYQNQRAEQAKNQIDQALNLEAQAQQEQRYKDAYDQHRDAEADFIDQQREKLETRDTDFDRSMDKMVADQKKEAAQLDQLQKIRNAALEHGVGNADEPGDVVGKASDLIDDILSGKDVSQDEIEKVAKVVRDRVSGSTQEQGEAYIPQDYLGGLIQLPSTMDEFAEGVLGSYRTAFTGVNPDGSISWPAMITRMGLAFGTEGLSEWGFTPVNMAYNSKDAIDRGASDKDALQGSINQAAFEILTGKAIGVGLTAVGKGAKIAAGVGRDLFKELFPATSKSAGKVISKIANKISKAFQGAPVPKPIPTAHLDSVNRMLKNALKSGDEKALLNLYKNGGMKDLAKLEELGHISPEAAKTLNKTLTKAANQAIDKGTENAINTFQKNTGVNIKKIYIGDSGSSAKGGPRSVLTDFDRTGVPEFEPKSLQDYAAKNGISPAEAERQLKKEFCDTHFNEVDQSLKDSGMPGGAADVDYKTYDGIGSNAGNSDAYSYGFTSQRQSLGGKTKVYVPDGKGGVKTYETSGEALVDADGLQKAHIEGALPDAPNRVVPDELPSVISQQAKSASKHSDVKSLAKGIKRTDAASRPLNIQNPDLDELSDIAHQINAKPQEVNSILEGYGTTAEEFVEQSREVINQVNDAASQMKFP
jgi:hypothetical protein